MVRTSRPVVLAVLASLALLVAACGDDDTADAASDTTAPSRVDSTFPVTISSGGVDTEIAERPEAIVSLSPTATEMVFAIGAGDQVVAVDDQSDFPEDAPSTDLSSYEPNVEAVLAEGPDLVLLSDDTNDVVAGLEAAGVPALVLPAAVTIEDTYEQIELVGKATGHLVAAEDLVAEMEGDIDELVAQVPEREVPLTYFHELDDTLFTVTSDTFIGQIYALAGLENVADAADPEGEAAGYPQLSAEYLIDADPDLIFLADAECCAQDADTLAARPGFDQLTAVQRGDIVLLDEDVASRWGPRIVDFLETIVEATAVIDAATSAG